MALAQIVYCELVSRVIDELLIDGVQVEPSVVEQYW